MFDEYAKFRDAWKTTRRRKMVSINQLRQIRKNRGLAIAGLAAQAGASAAMICAIERWGHVPRPETRERLAQALGATVDQIWPNLPECAGNHQNQLNVG